MTLQDYINLVSNSLRDYFKGIGPVITPIIVALIIFIVGIIVAMILRMVWVEITKFLNLEKNIAKLEAYSTLVKTNKSLSVTELVGSLVWWSAVIVFVVPALKAFGINQVNQVLNHVFGYVPVAIVGALYLSIGALVAWFAYNIISGVGAAIKVPASGSIAKVVSAAVVVFSLLISLRTLGVSDEMVRFMILGVLSASALAFGLAGKDLAADILKKAKEMLK